MAAVHSKDGKAELALRRALHRRGLRFRLHARDIEGRPDIVLRSKRLAVFGDMWHGNAWKLRGLERLEDMFPTNTEFWTAKITRNVERDRQVTNRLAEQGWTVVRIWESDILADPDAAAQRCSTPSPPRRARDALPLNARSVSATPRCRHRGGPGRRRRDAPGRRDRCEIMLKGVPARPPLLGRGGRLHRCSHAQSGIREEV